MPAKRDMNKIGYFRHFVSKYRRYFWNGIIFLALTDVLDVIPPLIIMKGVDQIIARAGIRALSQTALLFTIVTLALALVRFHWRMQFGQFHQNVAKDLREKIFTKLSELGPTFYGQNPIGELMSLVTNDVEAIRMGMGPGLIVLTDAFLYFLTIPPIMFSLSVPLTFKTLILLPTLPFFINWLGGVIHRRFLLVQDKFSDLSGTSQENIAGIRVIKSYAQENNQLIAFNKKSRSWYEANLKVAWAESFMHPVMEFCVSSGMVMLLFFGSKEALAGTLTVGAFVAFQRYISKMVWPMTAIGWGFTLVAQGRASLKRVDEFLKTPPDVPPPIPTKSIQDLHGPLVFKNLHFQYPHSDKLVLKNVSFSIEPGDTFGLVGPVGSGKTTLVQLLCHLYELERGQIFINGIDIRDIPLEQLRKHISLVPQDPFLFSSSIVENMSFGLETSAEMDSLKRVAEIARLDEEIESLPNRYETYLGERGVNLSGGQKQRMTITRALLRKSPVIIFDDSLSAVDAETEMMILKKLREEIRNKENKSSQNITIIISHRLSTLALCNRIAVLKNGYLEAVGHPLELRRQSPTYQELLHLQGYM